MMGCQPESSSQHYRSSSAHNPQTHYSVASLPPVQNTLSVSQPAGSRDSQPYFVHTSVLPSAPHHHHASHSLGSGGVLESVAASGSFQPSSADPLDVASRTHPSPHPDSFVQQQRRPCPAFVGEEASTSQYQQGCGVSVSQSSPWPSSSSASSVCAPQLKLSLPPGQRQVHPGPSHTHSTTTTPIHPHSLHNSHHASASSSQPSLEETNFSQQQQQLFAEQPSSRSPTVSLLRPPPSFAVQSSDSTCASADGAAPYGRAGSSSIQSPKAGGLQDSVQQRFQQPRHSESLSPALQFQLSPTAASSTMLEKKPTLQVVTTDHSPISPGSSATSSPRFVFPDMQASSSSGHLGSESGSSPFMSPVKHEVKLEIGTPPQASEMEQGHQRERRRICSGDTELSETMLDSETGSSLLEDSSSSREQSPFSAMAESLSLRSPSEHSPSPLTRKALQHHHHQHAPFMASEEEETADRERGEEGGGEAVTSQPDHPHSKFKRRLHERYVLSLRSEDGEEDPQRRVKKEESGESWETESQSPGEWKRPVSKMEGGESPEHHRDSPMPKSPRRSSSDTDMVPTESTEVGGASSADEGDVFLEPPAMRARRTKHKPPSLHQREPLDLSRGLPYPGFRSSSGSSPLLGDTEHLSPSANKIFSPVFRSPHRGLPYSPHGLMSPQSQSPLCSVPEGGRIFNFNVVPSPHEGPHSDSDLISPSPVSPRIFTFPPPGSIPNPMAEVNRLAVSPRAPYTPPPSFLQGKSVGGGGGLMGEPKWGDAPGLYSKRSLSESDVSYLCPVCGQVFPTNDNLAKHMTKHLPSDTAPRAGVGGGGGGEGGKVHYCKVCQRSFSRSDMLTRHMRLHTGLKPYECLECGQVFSRSDHLNTHRRTHTGEKPYRCPHCPYAACRRDMITRHMRTHAKRTSRRTRYLAVPDEGEGPKASGDRHKASESVSSTDTGDSQDPSTGVHTCSVSSMDSVEWESLHSPGRPPTYTATSTYLGASVDSLLSPGPHSSPSTSSSRKASEDLEEGMEGGGGGGGYGHFTHYRKARNWSTTSLESVDSEEAVLIREVLVDDAFYDPEPHLLPAPGEGGGSREGGTGMSKDMGGLDTKTLQKCFISSQPPAGSSSSS